MHTIAASVTDFHALPGSDTISVTIDPATNTAPTVTITAPVIGSTFTEGDSVGFNGTATDTEDGDISANLNWTSDLDGAVGCRRELLELDAECGNAHHHGGVDGLGWTRGQRCDLGDD